MKILFLLPEFPYPPSTGGRSKIFNELSYLSKIHQCDLLCFGDVSEERKVSLMKKFPDMVIFDSIALPSGMKKWFKVAWSLLRLMPPSFAKFSSNEYRSVLSKILINNNYDVIHYDIVNMAQYLNGNMHIASVHSPNDATSLSYLRMAEQENKTVRKILLSISSLLLKRFENKYYPKFTKVHVVSAVDANYLDMVNTDIDIDVIPITIDGTFLDKHDNSSRNKDGKTIICTGNFGNSSIARGLKEFLEYAYPLILQALPKVKVLILGQHADESLISLMNKTQNVEFHTWVENYRDFLVQADVVLAPDLAGTGIKTRVIQAMGLGLPVLGTKIAFEGIPIIDRQHGFIYQSPAECADIFINLLENRDKINKVGGHAHLLAKEQFSLSAVGPRYEHLYVSAIEKHKSII